MSSPRSPSLNQLPNDESRYTKCQFANPSDQGECECRLSWYAQQPTDENIFSFMDADSTGNEEECRAHTLAEAFEDDCFVEA